MHNLLNLRLRWVLRRGRGQVSTTRRTGRVLYSDVPDHTHAEVLHATWWRNTTADALMVGREAHAYVIWGHSKPQTLVSLLGHGDPSADDRASRGDGRQPTNVLALQRSGTANESVTFVVFRDEPKLLLEDPGLSANDVPLNLDRLAPTDDFDGRIDIFLGLPKGVWWPIHAHPVTAVFDTAISHWLTVQEVQLPVPPPLASYGHLQWARIRIGLRDDDLAHLGSILTAVHELSKALESQHPCEEAPEGQVVVAIRIGAERVPRVLNPRSNLESLKPDAQGHSTTRRQLVLASQLDVVDGHSALQPKRDDRATWRIMAIIPDWRYGIEYKILGGLDDQLQLVGMSYVILYGKAVVLLLGNRANGDHDLREADPAWFGGDVPDGSVSHRADVRYLNEWRYDNQIGLSGDYPLLRVRMRTPDRPGATLQVIESLSKVLSEKVPGSLSNDEPNVWYAHVEVASGRVAQISFTVRLTVNPTERLRSGDTLEMWGPREYFTVERDTLTKTERRAGNRSATPDDRSGAPQDTVISIELVRMPEHD
jgi:hypothetical protein